MNILLVMVGGFFGAIVRFKLGEWIQTENGFPLGTFLINLIGCFLLGWFLTFMSRRENSKPQLNLLIGTGFTGAFTTFSTFSVETIHLFQDGHILLGMLYTVSSIGFGLVLAYLGSICAVTNKKESGTV